MQIYDVAMLVLLVGTAIWGAWKGMAWQVASLTSLVASYIVALRFSDTLAPYLSNDAPWNRFLAMFVLYVGTGMAIWMAFRFVSNAIERVRLKEFDRQIGGLFGAAKGVVFCVIVTFFAVTLSDDSRQVVLKSRSGHYIAVLIDRATPIMPAELHDVIGPYLDQLHNQLDPNQQTAEQPGWGTPADPWAGQPVDAWSSQPWNTQPGNPQQPPTNDDQFNARQPVGFPANR